MSDVPLFTPPVPVTTQSASNAYKQVVSLAGYHTIRDAVDLRVISNVLNRTFTSYPHSQSEVGGWPALNTYNVPSDLDRDGMPDYWELAVGSNPQIANNNHTNSDGYTDLEHYLNWLADLHAVGPQNIPVEVNLWSFTVGMTNATFSVANATNGAVALRPDGHTARFTPANNFYGRGSFQFGAVDATGGGMTNSVGVLITPVPRSPHFTSISANGGKTVVSGIGGLPYSTYYALMSTSLSGAASSWMRLATNQFDGSGNFSFTNAFNPNVLQTWYRLQIP
jgi:hypothetical protein